MAQTAKAERHDEPDALAAEAARQRARREARLEARKRTFLRMASHELRTPLNSILGFSEIIAAELYGPLGAPQYREYAEIIRTSGRRLLKLVNQMLEIARLEGQPIGLDVRDEPLDHAIDDVIDGMREEIAARGVRIAVKERGSLPQVAADARGLRTVLTNLLQNALAYSPPGALVRVNVESHDGWVETTVEDDGPGVDPRELGRILQPFEQGATAEGRRGDGAGLGLPICDLLCRAMGGRLRLRSAPGRGFAAHVRLPVARGDAVARATSAP